MLVDGGNENRLADWSQKGYTRFMNLILTLLAIVFSLLIISFKYTHPDGQVNEHKLSLCLTFITIVISTKLIGHLIERRQHMRIFERANIPSMKNTSLLSGNYFDLFARPRKNLETIHSFHEKLGKNFGMFYGPAPWVMSIDLDLLQKVFVKDAISKSHIDKTQFRLPFMDEINNSLGQLQGDKWRFVRRVLEPSFAHKQMQSDNVGEDIRRACEKLLDCIAEHPLEGSPSDGHQFRTVDVVYNFKKFTIEMIFRIVFGREGTINMRGGARDPLIDTLDAASKSVNGPGVYLSIMFDSAQKLLSSLVGFTLLGRVSRDLHSVLGAAIAERRRIATENRILRSPAGRRLIDTIIELSDSNKLDDSSLRANLFFIFLAGYETSANSLAILFWLLAKHGHVQERLRSALVIDGERAQYLDWCINETLRLYPAVPGAIGRVVQETFEHAGQTFFKGMSINASIWSIHRWPEYWGPDVDEFRPERFSDEAMRGHPMRNFAFSHGPRRCIGTNLALAEMRAIVTQILLRYRLEFGPRTPLELDFISPNVIHMIFEPVELSFIRLESISIL